MIVHEFEQGSPEWYNIRIGKVTGTTLKDVMKPDNLPLVDSLIGQLLSGMGELDDYMSDDMQRGIELQPIAIDFYQQETGLVVSPAGFLQSTRFERFGMSPDGLVGKVGGIEVKCPKTKTHVKYLRMNQLPNDYRWQVISAFMINPELEWWDFISFDPRVSQRPLFIHRTKREDVTDDIKSGLDALEKFFEKLDKYHKQILFPEKVAA